jgi:hypothetical protein
MINKVLSIRFAQLPAITGLAFLSEKLLVLFAVKVLPVVLYESFCHFLALMQESNQRKSRKNNASPRKIATRTPLFFPPHAHGILFFDDFLSTNFQTGNCCYRY